MLLLGSYNLLGARPVGLVAKLFGSQSFISG